MRPDDKTEYDNYQTISSSVPGEYDRKVAKDVRGYIESDYR